MTSWEGKTRGGTAGYAIFIFLLRRFDIRIAYFVLRFVALYFVFFAPTSFKALYSFYHHRLGYGVCTTLLSIYKNYYSFGQVLLDKIVLMSGAAAPFTYDFADEVHLNDIIEGRRGGLLIGAHVGSWEIAAQLLNRLDVKFNVVMLDAEHESIKKQLSRVEQQKNISIIPVGNDLGHILRINEALSDGELVCIHGDRYIAGSKTLTHSFLGSEAKFPYGVFYLAARYHVPVTFVSAMKTGPTHYKLFATPPKFFDTADATATLEEQVNIALDAYAHNLEAMVAAYPGQWFNYYHFWIDPT